MTADRPALVIGAGPSGLMAAESLAEAGLPVVLAEAMPTPARKFLMAGKSGLNLTKDQSDDLFRQQFSGSAARALDFGPRQVMEWAEGLGVGLFVGSTGRVFPQGMKASPLLRAWLARLRARGVQLRTRWRWTAIEEGFVFQTPQGDQRLLPAVTVLALGGASWPRLGSDASWVDMLRGQGVEIAPFQPANMGFRVAWSPAMARHFGRPVKGTRLQAGALTSRGEWILSRHGIEGGGIYEIAAALREGEAGQIDLAPDLDLAALTNRFRRPRGKLSLGNWLRRVVPDPVRRALLLEWGGTRPDDARGWALRAKALPIRHLGPMGLDRAISSAGGIVGAALDDDLQLKAMPGVFAAGEMLDWEAPTGGYLLTACLSQGRAAGRAAARLVIGPTPPTKPDLPRRG